MEGRYFDGLAPRAQAVEVRPCGDEIVFHSAAGERRWPLRQIEAEPLGREVRLRPRRDADERLVVATDAWQALAGEAGGAQPRGEGRLVAGLCAAALAVAAAIFVGVPAISGPLAERTPPAWERQIGDNIEAQVTLAMPVCQEGPGQAALARLAGRLQQAAGTPFELRVRAVHAPMANAFALPGGAILVTDDLIELAASPDELAAVVAHEAAHVERRHVMQGVWRTLGLGLLLDAVVGGGSGAGQQAVLLAGSFTELRFSRQAEAEADARGQQLLEAAGLSSAGMAPFFRRLAAEGEGEAARAVTALLSDHPDTESRARRAQARARHGPPAFSPAEWAALKSACARKPAQTRRMEQIF